MAHDCLREPSSGCVTRISAIKPDHSVDQSCKQFYCHVFQALECIIELVMSNSLVLYLYLSCLITRSLAWYIKWCIYHICCHLYSGITSLFSPRFIPIMLDIKSFISRKPTHSAANDR